jgi:hypothetical protein
VTFFWIQDTPEPLLKEPFESNLKTLKSASGKRHPGEKHSPRAETGRPQQCSEPRGK